MTSEAWLHSHRRNHTVNKRQQSSGQNNDQYIADIILDQRFVRWFLERLEPRAFISTLLLPLLSLLSRIINLSRCTLMYMEPDSGSGLICRLYKYFVTIIIVTCCKPAPLHFEVHESLIQDLDQDGFKMKGFQRSAYPQHTTVIISLYCIRKSTYPQRTTVIIALYCIRKSTYPQGTTVIIVLYWIRKSIYPQCTRLLL